MKIRKIIIILILSVIILFILSLIIINHMEAKPVDVTQVNDLVKTLEEKGKDSREAKEVADKYGLAFTYMEGSLTVYSDSSTELAVIRRGLITIVSITAALSCAVLAYILIYVERNIKGPFDRLKGFASSVAAGNLDAPLVRDKDNIFGAFSESFDIMREELSIARKSEQKANESKRELVASLSHDIKTPLSSIKALAELLSVKSEDELQKEKLEAIEKKANQIEILVNNLFHATLEELLELKVEPIEFESTEITELIKTADYDHHLKNLHIEECLVYCDPMRLLQVFDNIISNSYKYADTKIDVSSKIEEGFLKIWLKDYGTGVAKEERPLLLQKFYRGSNSKGKSGTGIGLYVSSFFMKKMNGNLEIPDTDDGFEILLKLKLV